MQIALGAVLAGFGLSSATLHPEVFFLLFLPPLLFLDGWRMPNEALRRDAATIVTLALGLVVFTVLGLGLFVHWLVPAMPLAVAFALAAAVSPTDPLAVAAVARRTPVPQRLMQELQGEALFNDASGLVCMRYAVAAVLTGAFSWSQAVLDFLWMASAGVAVGVGVTWGVAQAATWSSQRWGEDGGAQILVTLLLPFGVAFLAELVHGSGILAAVAAGMTMSTTDGWPWRPGTRLHRTAVWDLLQAAANGSIFVLLGQQLPALVRTAPQTALSAGLGGSGLLVTHTLLIVGVLMVLRFVWVWLWFRLQRERDARLEGRITADDNARVRVFCLAGVRGAVTMAAVLTLPLSGADGRPFPARDLAILLAAGVIVTSLVLAAVGLPLALRGIRPSDVRAQRAAEAAARRQAAMAAIAAIRDALPTTPLPAAVAVAERVLAPYLHRMGHLTPGPGQAPRAAQEALELQLRLVALRAERDALQRQAGTLGLDEATLQRLLQEVDLLESHHGG